MDDGRYFWSVVKMFAGKTILQLDSIQAWTKFEIAKSINDGIKDKSEQSKCFSIYKNGARSVEAKRLQYAEKDDEQDYGQTGENVG